MNRSFTKLNTSAPNSTLSKSKKRSQPSDSDITLNNSTLSKRIKKEPGTQVPVWNFQDVKVFLDKIECPQKLESFIQTLKRLDYNELKFGDYTAESCKKLMDELIHVTRKYRTLPEILTDIKDNLDKKAYTSAINKSSLASIPKRPPTAYILFHAERLAQLRAKDPNGMIRTMSVQVADEWKKMPEAQKKKYRENEKKLRQQYDEKMRLAGLSVNQPKRPPTARTLYIENKIKDKNLTGDALAEHKLKYGQKFDDMSAQDKEKYLNKHAKLVEEYKSQMADYIQKTPHLNHDKTQGKSRKKPRPPTAPMNPFKFFLIKKKVEDIKALNDESLAKYKEKFNNLSENKLAKFIKQAFEDQKRYEEELKTYLESNPEAKIKSPKPNITQQQRAIYEKIILGRPMLPAGSAYIKFCGLKLANSRRDSDIHPTQHMQSVSAEWKGISDDDFLKANESVVNGIEEYIPQMEAWLEEQDEATKLRIQRLEPRAMPDFWKKILLRRKKTLKKLKDNGKN